MTQITARPVAAATAAALVALTAWSAAADGQPPAERRSLADAIAEARGGETRERRADTGPSFFARLFGLADEGETVDAAKRVDEKAAEAE